MTGRRTSRIVKATEFIRNYCEYCWWSIKRNSPDDTNHGRELNEWRLCSCVCIPEHRPAIDCFTHFSTSLLSHFSTKNLEILLLPVVLHHSRNLQTDKLSYRRRLVTLWKLKSDNSRIKFPAALDFLWKSGIFGFAREVNSPKLNVVKAKTSISALEFRSWAVGPQVCSRRVREQEVHKDSTGNQTTMAQSVVRKLLLKKTKCVVNNISKKRPRQKPEILFWCAL